VQIKEMLNLQPVTRPALKLLVVLPKVRKQPVVVGLAPNQAQARPQPVVMPQR
jgi:hypothetical protein